MSLLLTLFLLLLGAHAQSACPGGNLLADLDPEDEVGVRSSHRLTDGTRTYEGEKWNTNLASRFEDDDAWVEWDLGEVRSIRGAWVQADDDDLYVLRVSRDGERWERAWTAKGLVMGGLRGQGSTDLDVQGRFVRLQPGEGDGNYSVSEVQLFCDPPEAWPPPTSKAQRSFYPTHSGGRGRARSQRKLWMGSLGLIVFLAPVLVRGRGPVVILTVATTLTMLISAAVLSGSSPGIFSWVMGGAASLFTVAWLGNLIWRARKGGDWQGRARRGALVLVAACGLYSWTDFGRFHGGNFVHHWDSFHYFVGSRYFAELGYEHLYDCATVSQADDGWEDATGDRTIRDLATNEMTTAEAIIEAHSDACHGAFAAERWAAFQHDIRMWRGGMSDKYWGRMFRDHGYNASPVWNMFGSAISNIGWRQTIRPAEMAATPTNLALRTASQRREIRDQNRADKAAFLHRLYRTASIDYALYALSFASLGWAFGLEAVALAMIVWGTGHAWPYLWTGGAYGRIPWFFTAVASLCLLKRGYPFLSGLSGGTSALLRLFPASLATGIFMRGGWEALRSRRLPRAPLRWLLGAALAAAVLIPASLPSAGGIDGYKGFFHNTLKHNETPLTNHMGVPTLIASRLDKVVRATKDTRLEDNFQVYKDWRVRTLKDRKPLFIGVVAAATLLLAWATRRMKDWEALAVSTLMFVMLFQLTCYYYVFILLLAPLAAQRLRWSGVLLATALMTQVCVQYVSWEDEVYLAETWVVLAGIIWLIVDRALTGDGPPPGETTQGI